MPKDIILDAEKDLLIREGDFVVADATTQHVGLILAVDKGHIRQWPLIGVGIQRDVLDDGSAADLRHRCETNLEYDGAQLRSFSIADDRQTILLTAYYGT